MNLDDGSECTSRHSVSDIQEVRKNAAALLIHCHWGGKKGLFGKWRVTKGLQVHHLAFILWFCSQSRCTNSVSEWILTGPATLAIPVHEGQVRPWSPDCSTVRGLISTRAQQYTRFFKSCIILFYRSMALLYDPMPCIVILLWGIVTDSLFPRLISPKPQFLLDHLLIHFIPFWTLLRWYDAQS